MSSNVNLGLFPLFSSSSFRILGPLQRGPRDCDEEGRVRRLCNVTGGAMMKYEGVVSGNGVDFPACGLDSKHEDFRFIPVAAISYACVW